MIISNEQLQAECSELVENLTPSELGVAMTRAYKLANDQQSDINRIIGITSFQSLVPNL